MLRVLAALFTLLVSAVQAHQIDEIAVRLETRAEQFRASILVDAAYMLPEFRGDQEISAKDLAWLRTSDPATWTRIRRETESYFRENLSLSTELSALEMSASFPDFDFDPPRFMTEGIAEMPPIIEILFEGPFTGKELKVFWQEEFGVVLIVQSGDETTPIISGETLTVLRRDRPGEEASPVPSRFLDWVRLGFRHITDDGPDHVFFVLGIFLLIPRWKPLLALSLIFTVAHSLTLALAVVPGVNLPDRPIEVAIALSIAWIGVENLRRKGDQKPPYLLVGVFGLIHGLGFARMLSEWLPADRPDQLIIHLAGFNVGVELGQILLLSISFLLFGFWKESTFEKLRMILGSLIALAGILWSIERLGGPGLLG